VRPLLAARCWPAPGPMRRSPIGPPTPTMR
jgi:hypothetical protein